MKLLLDQNLTRRIVPFLQKGFPGSTQVAVIGLERADDAEIWRAARDGGCVIVTNDADFSDLSAVHGAPPHVVWLRAGNLDKAQMLAILMKHREALEESFVRDGTALVEILG